MNMNNRSVFSSCEDLFQAIKKPIFIYDKEHMLVYANPLFFQLLNASREKLLNTDVNNILSNHIDKEVSHYDYEILDASIPFIFNVKEKKYLSRAIPITIGIHVYSVMILEDIELIDFIINMADDNRDQLNQLDPDKGISTIVSDLNGRIIESSKPASRLLGYSAQEFSNLSIENLDLSFVATEVVRLLNLQSNKSGLIISRMLRKKDGSFTPARIYIRYIKNNLVEKILFIMQSNQDYMDLEYSIKHRLLFDNIIVETKNILFGNENEQNKMISLVQFFSSHIDCQSLSIYLFSEDRLKINITTWDSQTKKTIYSSHTDGMQEFFDWLIKKFENNGMIQINDLAELPDCYKPDKRKTRQPKTQKQYYFRILLKDIFYGYIVVNIGALNYKFSIFSIELLKMLSELLLQYLEHDREQKKAREFEERFKKSFYGMINAVVKMVEERDPFTAGHQLRVAALATAIAKTMGLEKPRIEAVNLAALIHDIGKIKIPSEILSVPRKLNETEQALVKTHSQCGYDILAHIHFDAPVQQYVLDHHERLDGSGYPNGKKGTEIDLETRIISVADVYEAMISHRPYRPGMPINIALSELKKNANKLYDKDVVEAFLDVLLIQEFQFPPQFYKI